MRTVLDTPHAGLLRPPPRAIRVLIVDDSPMVRTLLATMLTSVPGFQVAGQARDGEEAVQLATTLNPDVITMDIRMPRMDGLEATRRIMGSTRTPILVLANSVYATDLNIAFNAVAAGALTVVEKPHNLEAGDYVTIRDQLLGAIRLVANVGPGARPADTPHAAREFAGNRHAPALPLNVTPSVIAIAAATGGPGALLHLLQALPLDFAIPIVVVQRLTPGFTYGFARWLGGLTPLKVAVARAGDRLSAGRVLLAPEHAHLTLTPAGAIQLDPPHHPGEPRPSATRLFASLAGSYGPAGLALALSSADEDGLAGLQTLRAAGGLVVVQQPATCLAAALPRAALQHGLAHAALTPDELVALLQRFHHHLRDRVTA